MLYIEPEMEVVEFDEKIMTFDVNDSAMGEDNLPDEIPNV